MTNEPVIFDAVEIFRREYQLFHGMSAERARQQRNLLYELESRVKPRRLFDVEGGELQGWAGEWLEEDGLHPNTVRKRLNMIRPFYSWAFARGFINGDQYLRIKNVQSPRGSSAQGKPRPYTRAELDVFWRDLAERLPKLPDDYYIRRWLKGTSPWSRLRTHAMRLQVEAIAYLALHCGLRREEIYKLTPDEIHHDNEYLVVHGKGGRMRKVPFTEEARTAVREWMEFRLLMRPEDQNATWLSCVGARFNQPMNWTRFQTILQDNVAPSWTLHRFRHTCGTEWLRQTGQLEFVQKLLGHARIQQTLAYAEIVDADISRIVNKNEDSFGKAVRRPAAA